MGFILGIISALSDASKNVLIKHNIKKFDPFVVIWASTIYSLVVLVPIMLFKGIPTLDGTFWVAFSIRIFFDALALILYFKSVQLTDLSLSLPMLALTPLFLIFTSAIINNEFPKTLGLFGVSIIICGAYLLNFKRGNSFDQPLLAIYRNKGVLMMLGVAILWSLTSALHKVGISHSNPYFYTGFGAVILVIIFTPLAFWFNKEDFLKSFKLKNLSQIIPVGLLDGASVLSQMIGQSIILTVFIISLKRVSIVFSSIFAWFFFNEPIKERIFPILLMVAGMILIYFS